MLPVDCQRAQYVIMTSLIDVIHVDAFAKFVSVWPASIPFGAINELEMIDYCYTIMQCHNQICLSDVSVGPYQVG